MTDTRQQVLPPDAHREPAPRDGGSAEDAASRYHENGLRSRTEQAAGSRADVLGGPGAAGTQVSTPARCEVDGTMDAGREPGGGHEPDCPAGYGSMFCLCEAQRSSAARAVADYIASASAASGSPADLPGQLHAAGVEPGLDGTPAVECLLDALEQGHALGMADAIDRVRSGLLAMESHTTVCCDDVVAMLDALAASAHWRPTLAGSPAMRALLGELDGDPSLLAAVLDSAAPGDETAVLP